MTGDTVTLAVRHDRALVDSSLSIEAARRFPALQVLAKRLGIHDIDMTVPCVVHHADT